ncbi:MAG TPA: amidohydrolase family protein [Acidimicrobiales bacterium]|nr:amidohydrolase family protein [Acidimicrobiales bacterium]
MPSRTDVVVFDADNHFYETTESLTRHLPDRYRSAIQYVKLENGRTKLAVGGKISEYIPNPTFDVVARPGAQEEYYRVGNPEGKSRRELFGEPIKSPPAFRTPAARLELMDEQGLDRTLMFPTLASVIEQRMKDDPHFLHAAIHALNEWMYEEWQFDFEGRIFSTPVITLPIVEKAIEELEWVVERGAKVVLIRPAPVPGFRGTRSFALPEFDPFWKRVTELDILVALHSSDSGYDQIANWWEGSDQEMLPFQPAAFRMLSSWRPIEDSVASLIAHGALTRHPELKIAVVENGASWVEPLQKALKDTYKKMPQDFPEEPVAAMRRCIHISPFWEEDYGHLSELLGEDNVLFGSDYPHPEGLSDPLSYIDDLSHHSEERIRKFMGGNLARLMNIENTPIAPRSAVAAG